MGRRAVEAGAELTWDYGNAACNLDMQVEVGSKPCLCGASRWVILCSIRSWSCKLNCIGEIAVGVFFQRVLTEKSLLSIYKGLTL